MCKRYPNVAQKVIRCFVLLIFSMSFATANDEIYTLIQAPHPLSGLKQGMITVGEQRFQVEIADTATSQQQGLMQRRLLPNDQGMLFIFPESRVQQFWMKNTPLPLDMLFFDEALQLVHQVTAKPCDVSPCPIYSSQVAVRYVLEINAGLAERFKLHKGDKLSPASLTTMDK